MNSILDELFYGRIRPFGRIVPRDPEYGPLNREISGIMESWQKKKCRRMILKR